MRMMFNGSYKNTWVDYDCVTSSDNALHCARVISTNRTNDYRIDSTYFFIYVTVVYGFEILSELRRTGQIKGYHHRVYVCIHISVSI